MPEILPVTLQRRRPGRIRPGLSALRRALRALGNPQHCFPSILVAGTNGKGSTVAMLAAVLEAHSLAVGRFTSPHLLRVEERVCARGRRIARFELERHLRSLEPFEELTFFEALTAAAFLHFAEESVDCAVLEAGMGGRWDATRLAGSEIVGLTNVGTDHQRWLGSSREDIAADKGQALAAASIAILGPGVDAAIAPHLGAPHARAAADLVELRPVADGRAARWDGAITTIRPPLPGAHQIDNLHLALALARAAVPANLLSGLDPEAVGRGLRRVTWPGRLSRHRIHGRPVLLDGAHNVEAATALAEHLGTLADRHHLLFSCLDDKPVEAMAAILEPVVGEVTVCPLHDQRATDLPRLQAAFPASWVADGPIAGLDRLPDPIVAAGSLRLAAALLEAES